MIVNLRGTNGSGKSTVPHTLIAQSKDAREVNLVGYTTEKGAERFVVGYHLRDLDLCIVGKYATACGGCDGVKTQDLICAAVIAASRVATNVLFEGVIVSTLFSRYLTLAKGFKKRGFTWAYLDTPLKTCLERIQKRNGGKEIKEDLVASKTRAIASTRVKAEVAGQRVKIINHKNAVAEVKALFIPRRYK